MSVNKSGRDYDLEGIPTANLELMCRHSNNKIRRGKMGDKLYRRLLIKEIRNTINKSSVLPSGDVVTCVGNKRIMREAIDKEDEILWGSVYCG